MYPVATMSIESILAQIDQEIARLTQARKLLESAGAAVAVRERKPKTRAAKPRKARVLSAEARKRIADAQRKRWAAQKAKAKKEA
jgi:uncharacterized protein with WD repeat